MTDLQHEARADQPAGTVPIALNTLDELPEEVRIHPGYTEAVRVAAGLVCVGDPGELVMDVLYNGTDI